MYRFLTKLINIGHPLLAGSITLGVAIYSLAKFMIHLYYQNGPIELNIGLVVIPIMIFLFIVLGIFLVKLGLAETKK